MGKHHIFPQGANELFPQAEGLTTYHPLVVIRPEKREIPQEIGMSVLWTSLPARGGEQSGAADSEKFTPGGYRGDPVIEPYA
jgi:hypothetical protein